MNVARYRWRPVWGVALTLLLSLAAEPVLADCSAYRASVEAALLLENHDVVRSAYDDVAVCADADYRAAVGREIAARLYNLARTSRHGADENAMEEILHFAAPWQVLAELGDIAAARGKYAPAAARYQEALMTIADAIATPTAPPADVIRLVRHKAEEAGLLSARYVPTPRGRGDENEGLAAVSIRGVTVTQVQLPVQFVFGSAEFTPEGLKAAEDMASFITNEKPAPEKLILIGHTDRVGNDSVNLPLSLARARALADFLREHGVTQSLIVTEGRGSSEPYPDLDPADHTDAQRDQLDRRVELIRQ